LDHNEEILKLGLDLRYAQDFIINEMAGSAEKILVKYPIAKTIELIFSQPAVRAYNSLSNELADQFQVMEREVDLMKNTNYKKLLLVELMLGSLPRISNLMSPATQRRYLNNFKRICFECGASTDLDNGFSSYNNDAFLKNLGVSSLFIVPLGAQKVNKNKLPIYWLRQVGTKERFHFLANYAFKVRGRSPFYDMHTDSQDKELLSDFTRMGWQDFLRELAGLTLLEPEILGAFGIGWFFDPKSWEISPRLSYLGDLIKESNAHVYKVGESRNATESALATSPTRRSLYEQKRYSPCDYIAIWDRAALLKWNSRSK